MNFLIIKVRNVMSTLLDVDVDVLEPDQLWRGLITWLIWLMTIGQKISSWNEMDRRDQKV